VPLTFYLNGYNLTSIHAKSNIFTRNGLLLSYSTLYCTQDWLIWFCSTSLQTVSKIHVDDWNHLMAMALLQLLSWDFTKSSPIVCLNNLKWFECMHEGPWRTQTWPLSSFHLSVLSYIKPLDTIPITTTYDIIKSCPKQGILLISETDAPTLFPQHLAVGNNYLNCHVSSE